MATGKSPWSSEPCATTGIVSELQRWNLDALGLLVDFLLDDVFLHFNCVDDMLNVRVHTLLRLFLRLNDGYLNDLLSE